MNKIERKRLEKLIGFLKKLKPEKFNFGSVISKWDRKHECGSVCCAIGWTPVIFPNLIKWNHNSLLSLAIKKTGNGRSFGWIASYLFGIDFRISTSLFSPQDQDDVHENLKRLPEEATPKAVAKMLEKFLKLVDKGEIKL